MCVMPRRLCWQLTFDKLRARTLLLKPLMLRLVADAGLHVGELDTATAVMKKGIACPADECLLGYQSANGAVSDFIDCSESYAGGDSQFVRVRNHNERNRCQTVAEKVLRHDQPESGRPGDSHPGEARGWGKVRPGMTTWLARSISFPDTRCQPELVDYGAATSRNLKGLAASLKGVAVRSTRSGRRWSGSRPTIPDTPKRTSGAGWDPGTVCPGRQQPAAGSRKAS